MKEDPMGFWTQAAELAEVLRKKYTPESLVDTWLYHLVAGSGIEEGHNPTRFDTPGGEFEKFLNSQEKSETEG